MVYTIVSLEALAPLVSMTQMQHKFVNNPDLENTALLETRRVQTVPPPSYRVLILNDDYTPMDFVVMVLQKFFQMDLHQATQVMLHVHTRGRAICGTYTREVAESKVAQVNSYSQINQHPLLCTMERS